MRNAYSLFLKNTVIVLLVILLCLISFVNSSSCLASENANSDIATVGYANNSSVVDVEAEEDQSTATSCESGGYISVRVTETPFLDTLISGLSFFLSVLALAVSFCSYRDTRNIDKKNIELQTQHNKDKVRPFVCIELSTDPFIIDIKNRGLGPAILTSVKWVNTETKKEEDTLYRLIEDDVLRPLALQNITDYYVRFETKPILNDEHDKDILAPNEMRPFISFPDDKSRNVTNNSLVQSMIAVSLKNVRVVIEYTDMYSSNTWRVDKDLTWFTNRVYVTN